MLLELPFVLWSLSTFSFCICWSLILFRVARAPFSFAWELFRFVLLELPFVFLESYFDFCCSSSLSFCLRAISICVDRAPFRFAWEQFWFVLLELPFVLCLLELAFVSCWSSSLLFHVAVSLSFHVARAPFRFVFAGACYRFVLLELRLVSFTLLEFPFVSCCSSAWSLRDPWWENIWQKRNYSQNLLNVSETWRNKVIYELLYCTLL